jgi:hypothetical protein
MLTSDEQQMLDGLVTAAVIGRRPDEIASFWVGDAVHAPETEAT